jgi:hypothetical protein
MFRCGNKKRIAISAIVLLSVENHFVQIIVSAAGHASEEFLKVDGQHNFWKVFSCSGMLAKISFDLTQHQSVRQIV